MKLKHLNVGDHCRFPAGHTTYTVTAKSERRIILSTSQGEYSYPGHKQVVPVPARNWVVTDDEGNYLKQAPEWTTQLDEALIMDKMEAKDVSAFVNTSYMPLHRRVQLQTNADSHTVVAVLRAAGIQVKQWEEVD